MRLSDRLVRCEACGTEFVYTVQEQRQRSGGGKPADPPPFCRDCRSADVRLGGGAETAPAASPTQEDAPPTSAPAAAAPAAASPDQTDQSKSRRPRQKRQHRGNRGDRSRGKGRGRGGPSGQRGKRSAPPRQTELRIRHVGTVKWFDDDRGYGFIAQEDGEELFVHTSGILTSGRGVLEQGQSVEYEVEHTKRGLQAVDVVLLS